MIEIDGVRGEGRIVRLANEIRFRVLECPGHFHIISNAQEQRACEVWQARRQVLPKHWQVEVGLSDECCHPRPTVGGWDCHAVDIGFLDSRKGTDRLRNFGGRNVLALPAERIADAVDKIEKASLILSHQVSGAYPEVTLLKHVAECT